MKHTHGLHAVLMAPDQADGTQASPPAAPPATPTWDSFSENFGASMRAAMTPTPEITTPAGTAPVVVPPPPAPAPAALPVAPAPSPEEQRWAAMLGSVNQTSQAVAMLLARAGQPAAPAAAPTPKEFDVMEAMESYRPPARATGETDDAYQTRSNAAVLTHISRASQKELEARLVKDFNNKLQAAIDGERRAVQQQAATQQAKANYVVALDKQLATAGFAPVHPGFQMVKSYVDGEITKEWNADNGRGWTDAKVIARMAALATYAKTVWTPTTAAPAPHLAVVPQQQPVAVAPPVAAGGNTSAPVVPQATTQSAPRSYEELSQRINAQVSGR